MIDMTMRDNQRCNGLNWEIDFQLLGLCLRLRNIIALKQPTIDLNGVLAIDPQFVTGSGHSFGAPMVNDFHIRLSPELILPCLLFIFSSSRHIHNLISGCNS
jgi:hypothetical protein